MSVDRLADRVGSVGPSDGRATAARIALVTAFFAVLPPLVEGGYELRIVTIVAAFTLFTVSLNVIFGHTDQLFLVVGGLAGVSAYTTVVAADSFGVSPWLTLPLGAVAAGLLGGAVSYVAAKRRFTVILIAIFTLALQLSLLEFFTGARSITGGSVGMPVEGVGVGGDLAFYYVFVAAVLGYHVLYVLIVDSRYGLAFDLLRQDDLAASSTGVDVVRYKVFAGVVGSVMIGVAGGLYALWTGYVSPGTFSFQRIDVMVLIMLTLGGMRTTLGPAVGAVVVTGIDVALAEYPHWRLVIFGVLLIVLYLYFRDGIVSKVRATYDARVASRDGATGTG